MNKKKRRRPIHLHVMVSEEELALIRERMAEAGVRNLGAYVRKMALNGYVLHVDLSDVRELVYDNARELEQAFTMLTFPTCGSWYRSSGGALTI